MSWTIVNRQITIIDRDNTHYYQPGFLFIPFGIYKPEDVVKSRTEFLSDELNFIMDEVETIKGREQWGLSEERQKSKVWCNWLLLLPE